MLAKEGAGSWAKHGAYTAAWKHLIYVESFRLVAKNGGLKTGNAARVYEHARDTLKGFEVNPIGRLISYLKRMEGVKVGTYEAGLKTKELDSLYKLEEIKPIVECLDDVAKKRPIVILVDELDNGWDASEDAKCFVSGLFSAATSINAKHGQNLRVIISLRRELFENIPEIYEDAQKISDMIEKISWTEENLLELIGRRIAKCFPEAATMTSEQRWNAVFSEKLSYRTANSFNYFIDRTLFRPREVIQFANTTADAARSQGLGLPIDYFSIAKAEGEYSKARLLDIASEYKHQFPGLSSLFETFRGLNFNMAKEEFHDHLEKVILGEFRVTSDAQAWVEQQEPEGLIRILWEVGFIKAQVVGGVKAERRSGSDWLGSHQISGISISNMPQYQVHPMFRTYLGMKEKKQKRGSTSGENVNPEEGLAGRD